MKANPTIPNRSIPTQAVNANRIDEIAKETDAENRKQQSRHMQPRKVTSLCFGPFRRCVHCFALLCALT